MDIIDNINSLLGDDIKSSLSSKSKIKIAASCFSIYAYEALEAALKKVKSLEFIFTAPTFVPEEVTDKFNRERREFFIPKADREKSLYGSEFEIQLRNKLTQRAIARECAEWMRRKSSFRSKGQCLHSSFEPSKKRKSNVRESFLCKLIKDLIKIT